MIQTSLKDRKRILSQATVTVDSDQGGETGYVTDSSQNSRKGFRPRAATVDDRLYVSRRRTKSERDRRRSRRSSDFGLEEDSDSGGSSHLDVSQEAVQSRFRKRASSKTSYTGTLEKEGNFRFRKRAGSRRGSQPAVLPVAEKCEIDKIEETETELHTETDDDVFTADESLLATPSASTSTLKMNQKDIYFGTWRPGERAILDQILHNIDLRVDPSSKSKKKDSKRKDRSQQGTSMGRKSNDFFENQLDGFQPGLMNDRMNYPFCKYNQMASKQNKKSILSLFNGLKKFRTQTKKTKSNYAESTENDITPVINECSDDDPLTQYVASPPTEKKKTKTELLKDLFTRKRNGSVTGTLAGGRVRSSTNTPSPSTGRSRTSSINESPNLRTRSCSVNDSSRKKPEPENLETRNANDDNIPLIPATVENADVIETKPNKKQKYGGSRGNLSKQRSASIKSIPEQLRNIFGRTKSVDNLNGAFQFYQNKDRIFQRSSSVTSLDAKSKKAASTEKLNQSKRTSSQQSMKHGFEPVQPVLSELGYEQDERMCFAKASYIKPKVATSNKLKTYHKHEHPCGHYDSAYEDDGSGYQSECSRAPSVVSAFPAFNRQISDDYRGICHKPPSAFYSKNYGHSMIPQYGPNNRQSADKQSGFYSDYNSDVDFTPGTPTSVTPIVARRAFQRSLSKRSNFSSCSNSYGGIPHGYLSESSFCEEDEFNTSKSTTVEYPPYVCPGQARAFSRNSCYSNMSTVL